MSGGKKDNGNQSSKQKKKITKIIVDDSYN